MPTPTTLVITIDTEADNEWARRGQPTYRNIQALPRLQALCDTHGMKATYLVSYDVARDGPSKATLGNLLSGGNCEIGGHLHPWRTPPYVAALEDDEGFHPYLHEYEPAVQREKLGHLGEALREELGVVPTSYRGGRWSLDCHALDALEGAGYIVDTTVSPGVSWRHTPGRHAGGSSFLTAPLAPYRPARDDPARPGDRRILEVPVSILTGGPLASICACPRSAAALDRSGTGRFALRIAKRLGLARPMWLHPAKSSEADLLAICRERAATGVLNMMFHSSELVAGGAPSVPDAAAEAHVWERLERVLQHLSEGSVSGQTLSQFARGLGA